MAVLCTRYFSKVGSTLRSTQNLDIDRVVLPMFSGSNQDRMMYFRPCVALKRNEGNSVSPCSTESASYASIRRCEPML